MVSGVDGGPEANVDSLQAGWTSEGSHEPVVDAAKVVVVHAWEQANGITRHIVGHTDGTSECVCVCAQQNFKCLLPHANQH